MPDPIPLAVSIWASPDGNSFLGSGVLLDRQRVLTAGHLAADGEPVYIGLIDGVAERRRADVLARHPQHDVAILEMEAQTPDEVIPPPLLDRYVDLSRQPIVLCVISPLIKSRVALTIYQAAAYSDADGEYELSPENARGHSGGVMVWQGLIAGVLYARAMNDPLCRAVSMHRLAAWIAGRVPGMALRAPPAPPSSSPADGDSPRRPTGPTAGEAGEAGEAVEPDSTPVASPASAQATGADGGVSWQPEFRSQAIDTARWNFARLLPFARRLADDPAAIEALLAEVGGAGQGEIEIVTGAQGAGKSAWMRMLYEAAVRLQREGRIALTPRFVDLEGELDRLLAHGSLIAARQELQRAYTRLLEERRANLFVVDGCARDNPLLSTVLQHLALFLPSSRLLIAVDAGFEPRLREILTSVGLPAPARVHRLRSVEIDDPQALPFCSDFIDAYREMYTPGADPREADDAQTLFERVRQLDFKTLDTHLLTIVYQTRDDDPYAECSNKTDFLECYCVEQLRSTASVRKAQRKAALDEDIALAAQLAFDQFNQRYEPLARPVGTWDPQRNRRVQALVREHQNLRDFLAARNLATLLQRGGKDDDARAKLRRPDFLMFDVPETVSAHVKRLVNRDEARDRVLGTIQTSHREVAPPTAQFMYYLLGRLDGAKAVARARDFLRDRRDELLAGIALATSDDERVQKLALLRTVFVSLIYLVDPGAISGYIAHLIEKSQAASVNRGFHRIYYGDSAAGVGDGAHRYLDDDPAQAWDRTRDSLMERLQSSLSPDGDGDDVSFDLCVFTLISFVRSRQAEGIAPAEVERVCALLRKCMAALGSDELRYFVRSFLIDVERTSYSPWDFIDDLYRLKSLPRQGWLDRGLGAAPTDSVETVAEHAYFCCLLAWFLLPEASAGDAYDKSVVLQMLLVHDLAETYIGDQVTSAMTADQLDQYRREESGAMHYLRAQESHGEISGAALAFERWQSFGGAGGSASALLAKDFDRLENLLQLYLYRDRLTTSAFEEFRDGLTASFRTSLVKGLAASLAAWAAAPRSHALRPSEVSWWRVRFAQ